MKLKNRSLSKRLRHPVRELLLDRSGRTDLVRLTAKLPELADCAASMETCATLLRPAYQHYIEHVSSDFMAASLESSAFLYSFARATQPRTIVDLGSGFSSLVLRKYAAEATNNPTVWSVDDHGGWLEKTAEFLQQQGCPSDNLLEWPNTAAIDDLKFDLIFHDMGNMTTRAAALPWVTDHLSDRGYVILDDMHKAAYRKKASAHMERTGTEQYSLRALTHDFLGRFAVMAGPPKA